MAGVDPLDKAFDSLKRYRSSAPDAKKEFAKKEAAKLADLKAAEEARAAKEAKDAKKRKPSEVISDHSLRQWVSLIAASQSVGLGEYLPQLPKRSEVYKGNPVGLWVAKIRRFGWTSDQILKAGIHRIDFDYPLREEELVHLISKYQGVEVGSKLDITDIPKYISGYSLVPLVNAAINSKRNILEHVGIDPAELYVRLKGMKVWNSIPISKGLARLYAVFNEEVDSDTLYYLPRDLALNVGTWSLSTWVSQVNFAYNKGAYSDEDRKLLEASGLVIKRVSGQAARKLAEYVKRVNDYTGDVELVKPLTAEQEQLLLDSKDKNTLKFKEDAGELKNTLLAVKVAKATKRNGGRKPIAEFPQARSTLRLDRNLLTTLYTYSADGYFPKSVLGEIKDAKTLKDIESLESSFLLILEGATQEELSLSDTVNNFRTTLRLVLSTVRGVYSILNTHFTEHPLKTVIETMLAEEETLVTPAEVVYRYNKKVMTHRQAAGFLAKEVLLL